MNLRPTGWVKKSKLLILIKLRRYEECEQIRTSTEKIEYCLIF